MALRSVLICLLAAILAAMCVEMRRIGQPLVSTHLRLLAIQALVGLAQAGQWGGSTTIVVTSAPTPTVVEKRRKAQLSPPI